MWIRFSFCHSLLFAALYSSTNEKRSRALASKVLHGEGKISVHAQYLETVLKYVHMQPSIDPNVIHLLSLDLVKVYLFQNMKN